MNTNQGFDIIADINSFDINMTVEKESRDKEYSPEAWQKEKYGDEIRYLSREEAVRRFEIIEQAIRLALDEAHQESIEEYDVPYEIDAVIVYGSWARTLTSDQVHVHAKSDLDLYAVAREDPVSLTQDLEYRIKYHLKRRGLVMGVEVFGDIIYTDDTGVGDFERNRALLSGPLILVGNAANLLDREQLSRFLSDIKINPEMRISEI